MADDRHHTDSEQTKAHSEDEDRDSKMDKEEVASEQEESNASERNSKEEEEEDSASESVESSEPEMDKEANEVPQEKVSEPEPEMNKEEEEEPQNKISEPEVKEEEQSKTSESEAEQKVFEPEPEIKEEKSEQQSKTFEKPEDGSEDSSEDSRPDPFVVKEDQEDGAAHLDVDSEGFLDVMGSGRLRMKTIVQAESKDAPKPARGMEVKGSLRVCFQGAEVEPAHDFSFVVQESEALPCLDLAVTLMRRGEEAHIIADPELAYGDQGLPNKGLPPKAAVDLFFKLESVSPEPDVTELGLADKFRIGRRKKDRGNFWFGRAKYTEAIQCYRRASEYFDDADIELDAPIDRLSLPEELQDLLKGRRRREKKEELSKRDREEQCSGERLNALNNLLLAQLKIDSFDAALMSAKAVLKIEPNNEKALYRKSRALVGKGSLDEAIGVLRRVTRVHPENKQAKADLQNLLARNKKYRDAEKEVYKRMVGGGAKGATDKASSSSTSSMLTWGLVLGSVTALVGSLAAYYRAR